MDWIGRMQQLNGKGSGLPQAGSSGPVSYAPGMMQAFSGKGVLGTPTARQLVQANGINRGVPQPGQPGRPTSQWGPSAAQGTPQPPTLSPDVLRNIYARLQLQFPLDSTRTY